MSPSNPSQGQLRLFYAQTKTIAVVGASGDDKKAGSRIPKYLQGQGYRILPVNPKGGELFGERVHKSLSEIEEPIDVVDVFRPAEEAPAIAREAVKIGANILWLQEGIVSEEAAEIAREGGMQVVMGICMGATHQMLGLTR